MHRPADPQLSLPDCGTVHSLLAGRGTSDRHRYFTFLGHLALVFLSAVLAFFLSPKAALVAGYAACAIWASHLIVDARKYTPIQNVGGHLWSDLVLYALLLTVIGFLLLQLL